MNRSEKTAFKKICNIARVWLVRAVSVQKYPRYVEALYVSQFLTRILRRRGVNLGKNITWLGAPIVTVVPGSKIEIGDGCVLCSLSTQTALGVNHPIVLRTLKVGAELRLGAGVRMSGTTICSAERIVIGDRCVIGANVTIVDTDFHALDSAIRSSSVDHDNAVVRPVEIGNDVFIGGGSYLLKGVKVGDGAVIGAGSVVTKHVPSMTIFCGNPARMIGTVGSKVDPAHQ